MKRHHLFKKTIFFLLFFVTIAVSVFSQSSIAGTGKEFYVAFGKNDTYASIDSTYSSFSVNYLSGIYQLITNDFVLFFDGEKSIGFFDIKKDKMMKNNLLNDFPNDVTLYEQKLKAIIQSYTTRMVKNQLFINDQFISANKK